MARPLAALSAVVLTAACASAPPPPPADVASAARALNSYTANLSVKVGGRFRAPRTTVIVGFRRPDRLRLEIPGPGGARLILVTRGGVMTAVFPRARAVFEGEANRRVLGDITGVALDPADVMDFLVGVPPATVTGYSAQWGPRLPKRVRGRLEDGTRLDVSVDEPTPGATVQDRAFEPPGHAGYRRIAAAEARELWMK